MSVPSRWALWVGKAFSSNPILSLSIHERSVSNSLPWKRWNFYTAGFRGNPNIHAMRGHDPSSRCTKPIPFRERTPKPPPSPLIAVSDRIPCGPRTGANPNRQADDLSPASCERFCKHRCCSRRPAWFLRHSPRRRRSPCSGRGSGRTTGTAEKTWHGTSAYGSHQGCYPVGIPVLSGSVE